MPVLFFGMNLREIGDAIEEVLDEKDSIREIAIKSSRSIIRKASQAIMSMHRKEDTTDILRTLKEEVWHLKSLLLKDFPDLIFAGFVQNAFQEYCEALIFHAILQEEDIPDPSKLGVNPEAYLMGLADVAGELRRESLEALRNGNIEDAEKYMHIMEEIYETLLRFNYPSGLVPLRPKQDFVRSILEKTRSEITLAIITGGRETDE